MEVNPRDFQCLEIISYDEVIERVYFFADEDVTYFQEDERYEIGKWDDGTEKVRKIRL